MNAEKARQACQLGTLKEPTGCLTGCGKCCQFFALDIGKAKLEDHAIEFLNTRGWFLSGRFIVQYDPCQHLKTDQDGGHYCSIYEHRPLVCRYYPQKPDWRPEGCTCE